VEYTHPFLYVNYSTWDFIMQWTYPERGDQLLHVTKTSVINSMVKHNRMFTNIFALKTALKKIGEHCNTALATKLQQIRPFKHLLLCYSHYGIFENV
jgi:hypothetical protein